MRLYRALISNALPVAGLLMSMPAHATTLRDVFNDGQTGYKAVEVYRAYRDFLFLEHKNPDYFLKTAVQPFLKALFIVASPAQVRAECASIQTLAVQHKNKEAQSLLDYQCGLHFLSERDLSQAQPYLNDLPKGSSLAVPGHLLQATSFLMQGHPELSLKVLSEVPTGQWALHHIEKPFRLTRARSFVAMGKYEDAIRAYQDIGIDSSYYGSSLEEAAWVLYRLQRFESVHILVDLIKTAFEHPPTDGQFVISEPEYFRAIYLEAYTALKEKRIRLGIDIFSHLQEKYSDYLNRLTTLGHAESTLKKIDSENLSWLDESGAPKQFIRQLDEISEQLGVEERRSVWDQFRLLMAIDREKQFAAKITDKSPFWNDYRNRLGQLRQQTWTQFQKTLTGDLDRSHGLAQTLLVLSDLGKVKAVWLDHSDGFENIDELMQQYREDWHSFDMFMTP